MPDLKQHTLPAQHANHTLQFTHSLPYGAILREGGVQFVVFSRSAVSMRVLLYNDVEDREPAEIIDFDRETDRWGDVWSVFVQGIGAGQLYHLQADGPYDPEIGQRFDNTARLIDPYAKALAGTFLSADDGIVRPPKCVVVDETFDWQDDRHLRRNLSESVIYEMHVRGFTAHPSANVDAPGTYLGVIEKIPYLKDLGVTAVELMPVHEFPLMNPFGHQEERANYWGYDPMAFFSPHRGYASSSEPGAQVLEFKQMVRALHQAGIEVILDVVFNHTAEGNELGPTFSFKGLENQVYYMLGNGGSFYRNYSGCGNTINGNHPVVREMIFNCLRHWVHNYHIDGFRFDLASILSRDRNGELLPNPPLVEAISEDPLLADTKIIAEAWDAAGAYQVGSFATLRWAEWNGRYRDDIRRFWRGDGGTIGGFATRLSGSADLYKSSGRSPYHSINFVTSHDGFTLNDLVTYEHKHNEANGEGNRDGDNNNYSCHYGVEGPTRRKDVNEVRERQIKNMMATLLLSQGVPMIVSGDEIRRTQQGNNNGYCQDNDISWLDWSKVDENRDFFRFTRALIDFRRNQPTVRSPNFLTGEPHEAGGMPDVSWYDVDGQPIDWKDDGHSLTCVLARPEMTNEDEDIAHHVMLMMHAGTLPRKFTVPKAMKSLHWRKFIDTSAASPKDIYPKADGPQLPRSGRLQLPARGILVYVAED